MHKNYPVEKVDISNGFGDLGWRIHYGIDFRPKTPGVAGDFIYATHDGEVVHASNSPALAGNPWEQIPGNTNNGNWIVIQGTGQHWAAATLYAHLQDIRVRPGQMVKAGEIVATMGYTGYVLPEGPQGTHLHWEMFIDYGNGNYPPNTFYGRVNPLEYMEKPTTQAIAKAGNKVTPEQLNAILEAIREEGTATRQVLTQDYYLGRGARRKKYSGIVPLLNRILSK